MPPWVKTLPPRGSGEIQSSRDRWTELIGLFKLAKAVLLVAVAIGALKLLHHDDVAQVLERWIYTLQLDPNNQYIHKALTKVWSVDDRTLKEISAGTFSYAGLFLIEGTAHARPAEVLDPQARLRGSTRSQTRSRSKVRARTLGYNA